MLYRGKSSVLFPAYLVCVLPDEWGIKDCEEVRKREMKKIQHTHDGKKFTLQIGIVKSLLI